MVLSTRRGSAALLCPGLSGPHGLGPRARTQAFLGSAPPRHSPAASTAAPPPAAALRSAAGGDPLLDTARGPAPGAGSPGQRAAAGRRLTRQAVAAALRALRNARRGPGARRRSAAAAPELLSKVLQAARPRPPLGRLRRRRAPAPAPAPAPARTSQASLSGARAAHAPARADLVSRGSRGRRGPQHEPRAVRTETRPRARGVSTRRASSEDPDSGGGPAPGAAPSRTAHRPVCAAAPAATRPRESLGRPAQPSSGGGERRGGAEHRPHPPPRPGTCCLCSRRGARSCRRRGRSRPRLGAGDAGPAQARAAARATLEAIHGGRDPSSLLPFTILVPRERSLGARGGRRGKADC